MQCIYGRKGKPGTELAGYLRKTGSTYMLCAKVGGAVDRLLRTGPDAFAGALYIATTNMEKGLDYSTEIRNENKNSGGESVPDLRQKKVHVPLPPPGSLVFTPRAYIKPCALQRFKDYQIEGVRFMFRRLRSSSGAMLADEMGLGKTFQAVALVEMYCRAGARVLVVAPCSLVGVWEREMSKWASGVRVYNGADRPFKKYTGSHSVLLLSYQRLAAFKDVERFGFVLVVCDEAHRLRTEGSQAFEALKKLGSKKLLLTGTPFQNSVKEYRALLSLVDARAASAKTTAELASITHEAVMRRRVERTSLSLPQKDEYVWIVHNSELSSHIEYYRDHMHTPAIQSIQKLRGLVNTAESKWAIFSDVSRRILESKHSLVVISRYIEGVTRAADVLRAMCRGKEAPLHPSCILQFTGNMHLREREKSLADFQAGGQKVIVLSAKCGGEGLTLVKAARMIILDSDWNPANDMQAMARVWRLGQRKPVEIHRFFLMGTVEEYILLVQLRKIELQRKLEGNESPEENASGSIEEEIEAQLSQEEEQNVLVPQAESLVHAWSKCRCRTRESQDGANAPIMGYAHKWTEQGLLLHKVVNQEKSSGWVKQQEK